MRNRLFGWEQFQKAKAEEPRLKADFQRTKDGLTAAGERIAKLEKQLNTARNDETKARNGIRDEENAYFADGFRRGGDGDEAQLARGDENGVTVIAS